MVNIPKKRPTLREVAEHAGVSTATVSLVVNGKADGAGITQATQEVVHRSIRELQYTPNRMASAVVTGRSRMVGVVSAMSRELFDTKFGPRVLSGFARGARRMGYHFVFLEDILSIDETNHFPVLKTASEMCLEGLVLLVDIGKEEQIREIENRISKVLPNVTVQFTFAPGSTPGFRVDHKAAAKEIVEHLISLGHERVGFGARNLDVVRSESVIALLENSMAQLGGRFDRDLLFEIPQKERMGEFVEAIRRKRPTGLFTLYDGEAVRAIGALREAGIQVPEDLSITGYGNFPLSKEVTPSLTTYRPPMVEIGEAAIRHLIECIEQQRDTILESSVEMTGNLVIRGSTGPVPVSVS
ncbi:MAG: LacI family DNA-binding transcriptional regulator [Candidatus Omnitrophica bacterium]|nr:LacI family DNA-binding transcriptional regulator [Candidatus Omnitrophota bacterium]MCA9417091.1 LacI family DNA-binding transcriptional regulator [Candidatus Omnitrophota bacterium]MCA9423943.1 LacI family DNA-binding transcriptional regulator [Candidatus Omnitrophota bacterium]MCA9430568.1 LacI family DNA-binding transcriptional regulator [Candidatus Omnitrophota bacterium]MCA9444774.1 LacI family DNA-binding transcriptional regulator [Candidatus Omnitrophota bacterium]